MAGDERCPGCGEKFMGGDITKYLPAPFSYSQEKRKWHLRCHQISYQQELTRDRTPQHLKAPE